MLARLARVALVIALLAGWQAALAHSTEHGFEGHEESSLCDTLDGLTACAPQAALPVASHCTVHFVGFVPVRALRAAEAPPFFSQGPPLASV